MEHKSPLVSIIVPVYNYEKYVGKCIESLINQTYRNIEPVIVDDGSTDSSGKIIDAYASKDSRIKAYHKVNGGIGSAIKEALSHATGEYVAFLDSDDHMKLDAYENLVKTAEETNADVVLFGLVMTGLDGRIRGYSTQQAETIIGNDPIVRDYILKNTITPLSRKFCKRELLNDISMLGYTIGIDEIISAQLITKCNKFVKIEDCYYIAVGEPAKDSVSRRAIDGSKIEEQIRVQRDIISYFSKNHVPCKNDYIIRYLRLLIGRYVVICRQNEDRKARGAIKAEFYNWYHYIKKKKAYRNQNIGTKIQLGLFYLVPDFYAFIRGIVFERK